MLKKAFSILVCFSLLLPCFLTFSKGVGLSVSAESAIVMNALTGEVVYSKNPYEKRGIASTTKIMTSLLALEMAAPDKMVTVNKADVAVEGTSIYLKAGDEITISDLVEGMLLESGNDAANVTARAIAGNIEDFAVLMNKRAQELGMFSTGFCNPSGLTEDGHYSTAYDMALLGSAAILNEDFREICSLSSAKADFGEAGRTFYNHNKFLNMYDGAFGVKTGFTKASGRCLVTAAQRGSVIYVAVTLNAPDDWNDHVKMMDYAFDNTTISYVKADLSDVGVSVVGSGVCSLSVKTVSPLEIHSVKGYSDYCVVVYVPRFVYSGVNKGDVAGRVDLISEKGVVIDSSTLVFESDAPENIIKKQKTSLFERLKNIFSKGLS